MNRLMVKHNMEVAHRLSQLPGKCQQIHGHSMQVQLTIENLFLDNNGIAGGVDFGDLKKLFRGYIDGTYDHKLHLNEQDEWAVELVEKGEPAGCVSGLLPGLVVHPGDPTVENLAMWIAQDMMKLLLKEFSLERFDFDLFVDIKETGTNGAGWAETHASI